MKHYAINICPKLDSGLCNQIYSLLKTICLCIENKINILFIDKFYKQINSNDYCNISFILNMDKMNLFLSTYGIFLVDSKDFLFNIEYANILDKNHNKLYCVTNKMNEYLKDNIFSLTNDISLEFPVNKILKLECCYLNIKYKLNNGYFVENYPIKNNMVTESIIYDFNNLIYKEENVTGYRPSIFWEILKNIEFTYEFVNNANSIKKSLQLNNKSKINCIHLRLEDDFIEHYSSQYSSKDKNTIKSILENKYIEIIEKNINKDEQTIILTADLNNNVIKYLNENNYTFFAIPKIYEYREFNAIIDLEIGCICNNVLVIVYESSFSYTLMYKISKNNTNIKTCQLNIENVLFNDVIS